MSPSPRRQRAEARQRAAAASQARRRRQTRQRRLVAGGVGVVVILAMVAAVIGARSRSSSSSSASPSSSVPSPTDSTTTPLPATGVTPPTVPPGATLTGATPCPAADGSSPRTTMFAQAPPTCIDPTHFYTAVITTSKGPLTVQLNPGRAPKTVNDFVVLARYHFYDGQAVTHVEPQGWFDVGLTLGGGQADTAPGFTIPDEVPPQGQIFTAGTIAMTGTPGKPGTNRGALLVATFGDAPNIDQGVTSFGIMLDGQATLTAINAAASANGEPTEPITIRSITVTEAGPISS